MCSWLWNSDLSASFTTSHNPRASSSQTIWTRNVKVSLLVSKILILSVLFSSQNVFCSSICVSFWGMCDFFFFFFDGVALLPGPCWAAQWAWEKKDNIGETPEPNQQPPAHRGCNFLLCNVCVCVCVFTDVVVEAWGMYCRWIPAPKKKLIHHPFSPPSCLFTSFPLQLSHRASLWSAS